MNDGNRNPHHPTLTKHAGGTVTISCACGIKFDAADVKQVADLWATHLERSDETDMRDR